MSEHKTYIRASSLPTLGDCERQWFARQFPQELGDAGYEPREMAPVVGRAVGTAVHSYISGVLEYKREKGKLGNYKDALEVAISGFDEETGKGAIWDNTTPDRQHAHKQISQMGNVYFATVGKEVKPLLLEHAMKANLGGGFWLSGQIDQLTAPANLRDVKTGVVERNYGAQLGAYVMLLEHNEFVVEEATTDFIKRSKTHVREPITGRYDPQEMAAAARYLLARGISIVTAFRADPNKDPWHMNANPMSMMCTKKYCPVFGTEFCTMGREKDGSPQDVD